VRKRGALGTFCGSFVAGCACTSPVISTAGLSYCALSRRLVQQGPWCYALSPVIGAVNSCVFFVFLRFRIGPPADCSLAE
jgi:hypothetical protein